MQLKKLAVLLLVVALLVLAGCQRGWTVRPTADAATPTPLAFVTVEPTGTAIAGPSVTPSVGATALPSASPAASATPPPPTQEPSATAAAPTPVPPTATSTRPAVPPGERLQFQAGATSAVRRGHLGANQAHTYVLGAQAGQVLSVDAIAATPVGLAIWGANGQFLKTKGDGQPSWQGTLPATQDYYIELSTAAQPADYGLRATATARIQFAAGATSARLTSPVERLESQGVEFCGAYVLRALAGQTMQVNISSAGNDVLLTIVGQDGQPLKRYEVGGGQWAGTLPSTQDYYLYPVCSGTSGRFTLDVSVTAVSLPAPVRVQFEPGAISATLTGHLAAGGYARYILGAMAGQEMVIQATPGERVNIGVDGPGGQTWSDTTWEGTVTVGALPATGDYIITLAPLFGAEAVDYSLTITIQ